MLFIFSLFDTPEVRYHKLRRSVSQLTVTQMGKVSSLYVLRFYKFITCINFRAGND